MNVNIQKVNGDYDVIVVGGGPSGCAAGAEAARQGAKTLLVESTSTLGGMGTIGLVPGWCPFSDGEKVIYRGIAQEVFEKSKAGTYGVDPNATNWVPISPEDLKTVYDELVTGSGADILFGSFLCGADRDGGNISSLLIANKAGLTSYKAKVYIDCTGDGDIAAYAGVPFKKGGEGGILQPATLCFILTNVNMDGLKNISLFSGSEDAVIHKIVKSGKYPLIEDTFMCTQIIGPNTIGFNAGHMRASDSTDMSNISESMILGRKLAKEIRDGLAEFAPEAFGESFLVATAPVLGTRESRRIEGDYVLTIEDYLKRRTFEDEIARNCYYIDVHRTPEELERMTKKQVEDSELRYKPGESHGIPYRCLIPKTVNNLLVAGRAISCDRIVMGSTRVMPNCLTTGEAAGVAGSMAAKNGIGVREINVRELRNILKKNGAYIH